MQLNTISNRTMETETISKNGASSKSLMSRSKFFVLFLVAVLGLGINANAQSMPGWLIGYWSSSNNNAQMTISKDGTMLLNNKYSADFIKADAKGNIYFRWRNDQTECYMKGHQGLLSIVSGNGSRSSETFFFPRAASSQSSSQQTRPTQTQPTQSQSYNQPSQSYSQQTTPRVPPRSEWQNMIYIDKPFVSHSAGQTHGVSVKILMREEYKNRKLKVYYKITCSNYGLDVYECNYCEGYVSSYDKTAFFNYRNREKPTVSITDFRLEVINVVAE